MSTTTDITKLPLIHSFPLEVLTTIFEHLLDDLAAVFRVAAVSRHWRAVALAHSTLWLAVPISWTSVRDPDTLTAFLASSKGRPITLDLCFPSPFFFSPEGKLLVKDHCDYMKLRALLRTIVTQELPRCVVLRICGDETACQMAAAAFEGKEMPRLRGLFLGNEAADPHWQWGVSPSTDVHDVAQVPVPPAALVFPSVAAYGLAECGLRGWALEAGAYPSDFDFLRIENHHEEILVRGELNVELFEHVRWLELVGVCVPAMAYPPHGALADDTNDDLRLEHLVLANLRAMPRGTQGNLDQDQEGDCVPFFRALNTARLLSLGISHWDLTGRILDDFITALESDVHQPKFPCVRDLCVDGIRFTKPSVNDAITILLRAFPALRTLTVRHAPWEDYSNVLLTAKPMVCPELETICWDVDGIPVRAERRGMYVYM